MAVLRCAIGGLPVGFHARRDADLAPLAELLAGFPATAAAPRWRVLLLERPALPFDPRRGPPRDDTLPEGLPLQAAGDSLGRQWLVDGRLGITIDFRRRQAVCRLGGAAALLGGTAGIGLLDAILESEGQHLLHAALLALPPSLGHGALLLLGDSGAGKSSTALALARGGWALAGDDAAVLVEEAGEVAAWAFPRAVKVHPVTAGLLPWLRDLVPTEGESEVALAPTQLADLVALLADGRRLPLRGLAFLEARGSSHRLVRLGPGEAALRLTAEQLFAPAGLLTPAVGEQFRLMTRLAATARWRLALSLGPDLPGLPVWLEARMAAPGEAA